jgi:hypothetical protein
MENELNDWKVFELMLKTKGFQELTVEERVIALRFAESKEEYEQLHQAEIKIDSYFDEKISIAPKENTLSSLKKHLQKESGPSHEWTALWRISIPAYATVLLIMTFSVLSWWVAISKNPPAVTDTVRIETDTIFLASPPDTIFIERTIYKTKFSTSLSSQTTPYKLKNVTPQTGNGISMQEKEELETFLVSGSE